MEYNATFKRIETKYLISADAAPQLWEKLAAFMEPDCYGISTISNLYLDTRDNLLVRRSLDKPEYKEKLRLRAYGTPNGESPVYLEIKKKYKGIVYKRRVQTTCERAMLYLAGGPLPVADGQIMREIDYMMRFYDLSPKVYLVYDRVALVERENPRSSLRVTLDSAIRSRAFDLNLTKGDHDTARLTSPGQQLMEIKAPGAYPMWLVNILNSLRIYPTSFSKYGKVYTQMNQCERSYAPCLKAYSPACNPVCLLQTR